MNDAPNSEGKFASLILDYLREAVPDRSAELAPDTKILEIIDSFAFVEMFEFLESEMGVAIDLSEAGPRDLATVESFSKFLAKAR
jgi:acyl carrier protein